MEAKTYLYLVYENYKHYKNFNKFYKIGLTKNQLEIKEKHIDKDEYKFEFFVVPEEFAETVLKYVRDKFVKVSFPLKVESGELQAVCTEFINKCNKHMQEKSNHGLALPQQHQVPLQQLPEPGAVQRQFILLGNNANGEVTVLYNTVPFNTFIEQLSQFGGFQVLHNTVMSASDIESTLQAFQSVFHHLKTLSTDLLLTWYKISR
jgi:hypothetical protein